MSTDARSGEPAAVEHPSRRDRAPALVTTAILAGLLVFLVVGILTMEVPSGAEPPGPRVFPIVVAILTAVLLVLQAVGLARPPAPSMKADPDAAPGEQEARAPGTHDADDVNVPGLLGAVATFLAFTLLLQPLGWLIAATLLFAGVAWSLGARKVPTVLGAGLAIASVVQLAFGGGLGLALPPGILEGVF